MVIIIAFIFPQILVIGIVLQLKNPNYDKLLYLLNVTKIYYTLQNVITRYNTYIVLYSAGRETIFTLINKK